jgi:hypothetical protein
VSGLSAGSGPYVVRCPDGSSVRRETAEDAAAAHKSGCKILNEPEPE